MKYVVLLLSLTLSLGACNGGHISNGRPMLPYKSWYVGLSAPRYMEVWVESVDVIDQLGELYFNVFGGVAGYASRPEDWNNGVGKTMPVNNVDLPEQIILRWQSLVESKTYRVNINIPKWVRDEMVRPTHMYCVPAQRDMTLYPHTLTLGMAPGGIVKVWVGAGCLGYKEVGRFQAEVDPNGPYGGKTNGRYRPMNPRNKDYVDQYGIPYGSW
ncbi:DUF2931 family protein [Pseudomonas sp. TE3610]